VGCRAIPYNADDNIRTSAKIKTIHHKTKSFKKYYNHAKSRNMAEEVCKVPCNILDHRKYDVLLAQSRYDFDECIENILVSFLNEENWIPMGIFLAPTSSQLLQNIKRL
jgi:hypothetical protein